MFTALFLIALAAGAYVAWRSRVVFHLSVRDGRVLVVSGRVPGGFLYEARQAVKHPPVGRAAIRAMRGEHGAQLAFSGSLDEGRRQRLRNIFALYPASQLRSAPSVQRPTLGQLLGIAWLAWLLDRR
ncbi:MAG TPA: DUF3634 family protein [Polyangia bacterium]|nr:DUF3634 family protein [Polyangia bacterium]